MQMNLVPGQGWRHRHREQTSGHSVRKGEGGMSWEIRSDICAATCETASGNLWHGTWSSARGSLMTWGVGGAIGGRSKREGYMYTYSWFILSHIQKLTQYCKAIILQFLKIEKNENQAFPVCFLYFGISTLSSSSVPVSLSCYWHEAWKEGGSGEREYKDIKVPR